MLLVEFDINSTIHRISNRGVALEHYWDEKIITCSEMKYGLNRKIGDRVMGGMAIPTYGEIITTPDLFKDNWPPPVSCPVVIKYTESNESSSVVLFTGTAYLACIDRNGITFDLHASQPEYEISSTSFSGTLTSIFSALATALGLSYDDSKARVISPAVDYTSGSTLQVFVEVYSDIAFFFSHFFYINSGTLYLVDMLIDNGSAIYTEFDIKRVSYTYPRPPKEVIVDDKISYSSYYYGSTEEITPVCATDATTKQTAADNIRNILLKPSAQVPRPMTGVSAVLGKKLSWLDESTGPENNDINAWIRTREITFNFDADEMIIVGEGVISA